MARLSRWKNERKPLGRWLSESRGLFTTGRTPGGRGLTEGIREDVEAPSQPPSREPSGAKEKRGKEPKGSAGHGGGV